MVSFTVGALLPLLTILLAPGGARVPLTVAAVAVALALTGWASAALAAARGGGRWPATWPAACWRCW